MPLTKPPFKHYRGAKHCIVCLNYIRPSADNYNERIYCEDKVCPKIHSLLKELKPLCEKKRLGFRTILSRYLTDIVSI